MAQQPGNQPQGFGMQPGGIPPGANLAPTPFQSARNGVSPVGAGHGFADHGQPKDIQMTDASPSQTGVWFIFPLFYAFKVLLQDSCLCPTEQRRSPLPPLVAIK